MVDFTFHTPASAPQNSQPILENAQKRSGFIPSLYAVMAESPELLEGYFKLHELLLKSSFNNDEKTVVWQAINVEHNCHYCVPAHTAIAHSMGVDNDLLEALRNETPLPEAKLEALRNFTLKVIRQRGLVNDSDMETFFNAGYTQRNVLEIILCAAQKVISNYTNHVAHTPIDDHFKQYAWQKRS